MKLQMYPSTSLKMKKILIPMDVGFDICTDIFLSLFILVARRTNFNYSNNSITFTPICEQDYSLLSVSDASFPASAQGPKA